MEVVEEVIMGSNDHFHVVKGKRTKRQRPSSPSPLALTMITTSSCGEGDVDVDVDDNGSCGDDDQRFRYPTTSADECIDATEEEEDLANCLILLAQGYNNHHGSKQIEEIGGLEKFSTRKFISGTSTNTTNKSGFYVYECKTCNRCFPSFQALGGHRASHKKPKVIVDEKKALMLFEDDSHQLKYNSLSSLNNKSKIHECSICGSEFSSGQALGGHMRRHRATTATTTTTTAIVHTITKESQETKKPRIVLSLDLNLPATDHDDRDSKFSFPSKQQSLVFSPSPLVDCHY